MGNKNSKLSEEERSLILITSSFLSNQKDECSTRAAEESTTKTQNNACQDEPDHHCSALDNPSEELTQDRNEEITLTPGTDRQLVFYRPPATGQPSKVTQETRPFVLVERLHGGLWPLQDNVLQFLNQGDLDAVRSSSRVAQANWPPNSKALGGRCNEIDRGFFGIGPWNTCQTGPSSTTRLQSGQGHRYGLASHGRDFNVCEECITTTPYQLRDESKSTKLSMLVPLCYGYSDHAEIPDFHTLGTCDCEEPMWNDRLCWNCRQTAMLRIRGAIDARMACFLQVANPDHSEGSRLRYVTSRRYSCICGKFQDVEHPLRFVIPQHDVLHVCLGCFVICDPRATATITLTDLQEWPFTTRPPRQGELKWPLEVRPPVRLLELEPEHA